MKRCRNILCGLKPLTEFYKLKISKDGYSYYCKKCYLAKYYTPSLEVINRRKERELQKLNNIKHKSNKEKIPRDNLQVYHKIYNKQYWQKNKEKLLKYNKIYRDNHKQYYIIRNMVNRIFLYRNKKKIERTEKLLRYTYTEFLLKFPKVPKNYHIDHKVPISWFVHETPISIINNLNNLQLLECQSNFSKSNFFCHPISLEYFNKCSIYIKSEFISKINLEY